jgi:hypothetical protein
MDGIQTSSRSRIRRGGVLLELLLAIALFAAAASFTLSSLRAALDSVARAERRARAYDAAASRLAELDAGLIAVGDLGDDLEVDADLLVSVEVEPSPASRSWIRAAISKRNVSGRVGWGVMLAEKCERPASPTATSVCRPAIVAVDRSTSGGEAGHRAAGPSSTDSATMRPSMATRCCQRSPGHV